MKAKVLNGLLALCAALSMGLVSCGNIHEIEPLENLDSSIELSRRDILALGHLQETHLSTEEELQTQVLNFLQDSPSRNASSLTATITGSRTFVANMESEFSSRNNSRAAVSLNGYCPNC